MSGADTPTVALADALAWVVEALDEMTSGVGPTDLVVVGGIGVSIRLALADVRLRATADVDVVARGESPTALTGTEASGAPVDVMTTFPLDDDGVAGLSPGEHLFVAAHRWGLESAEPVRLIAGPATTTIGVARPAPLVAMKAHAIGFGRPARRATKRAGDLHDLFELVSAYDVTGGLRSALATAPWDLGSLVGDVVRRELLEVPARATRQINEVADRRIDAEELVATLAPLVA
jgi:hypothetical protein